MGFVRTLHLELWIISKVWEWESSKGPSEKEGILQSEIERSGRRLGWEPGEVRETVKALLEDGVLAARLEPKICPCCEQERDERKCFYIVAHPEDWGGRWGRFRRDFLYVNGGEGE